MEIQVRSRLDLWECGGGGGRGGDRFQCVHAHTYIHPVLCFSWWGMVTGRAICQISHPKSHHPPIRRRIATGATSPCSWTSSSILQWALWGAFNSLCGDQTQLPWFKICLVQTGYVERHTFWASFFPPSFSWALWLLREIKQQPVFTFFPSPDGQCCSLIKGEVWIPVLKRPCPTGIPLRNRTSGSQKWLSVSAIDFI